MGTPAPELSLVIPTYDERENIEEILRATSRALENRSYEVIVVDDDSPDRTWEVVEQIAASVPGIRLVRRLERPPDQAHSVIEGFRVSRGAVIGKMDADGSHDPRALVALLEAIDAGFDVAVGSRYAPGASISAWPLYRRLLSTGSTVLVRALLRLGIRDPLSGFWLMRREVYEQASEAQFASGFKILLPLCVRWSRSGIVEVPIHFRDRIRGRTKLRAAVVLKAMRLIISLTALSLHRPAKVEPREEQSAGVRGSSDRRQRG